MLPQILYGFAFLINFILVVVCVYRYRDTRQNHLLVLASGCFLSLLMFLARLLFLFFPDQLILNLFYLNSSVLVVLAVLFTLILIIFRVKREYLVALTYLCAAVLVFVVLFFFAPPDLLTVFRRVLNYVFSAAVLSLVLLIYYRSRQKEILIFLFAFVLMALGGIFSRFNQTLHVVFHISGLILLFYIILGAGKKRGEPIFGEKAKLKFYIGFKLSLIFLILSLLVSLFGISIFSVIGWNVLEQRTYKSMKVLAESRGKHVKILLREQEEMSHLIATDEAAHDFLILNSSDPNYSKKRKEINGKLRQYLEGHKTAVKMSLINLENEMVASSDESVLDLEEESVEDINYENGAYVGQVHFSKGYGVLCVDLIFPMVADKKKIGYIVLDLNLERINELVSERTGFSPNLEAYLVNDDLLMISPSNFFPDVLLKRKVDTDLSRTCIENSGEDEKNIIKKGVFRSYHGDEVIGASVYIPEARWCLLAEVARSDVLKEFEDFFFKAFVIYCIVSVVFLTLAGTLLSNWIVKPIRNLKKGLKIIRAGNLSFRLKTKKRDEIDELGEAINETTATLEQARNNIEEKVEFRTKEVVEKQRALKKVQAATLNILEDIRLEKDNYFAERNRLETVVESIGDGLFVVDSTGKILIFNPRAEKITGYNAKEVEGKHYASLLRLKFEDPEIEDLPFIEKTLKSGLLTSMANGSILTRKDGSEIHIADSVAPLLKGKKVVGAVIVFRDVSEERELERVKSGFVSIVSHQLRTPLSAIKWLLEMLLGGDAGKLKPEQTDFVKQVFESNQRLINLVNDLLKVSRLESRRVKIEPKLISVEDLVEIVFKEQYFNARAHNVELKKLWKSKKIPKISLDPTLIGSVIGNLVVNAIEYTKPGRKNVIGVDIKEKKDCLLISVADKGIGIVERDQKRIFSMFFRAENGTRIKADGSGLGLYIGRLIINLTGGEIWLKSKEDKGTTFYFTLPLRGMKTNKGEKSLNA